MRPLRLPAKCVLARSSVKYIYEIYAVLYNCRFDSYFVIVFDIAIVNIISLVITVNNMLVMAI